MPRRTITFIALFILLGLIGLGVFLFYSLQSNTPTPTGSGISNINKFFPFGNNTSTSTLPPAGSDTSNTGNTPSPDTTPTSTLTLMQLTHAPTAGFTPITTTRIETMGTPDATPAPIASATSTAIDPFSTPAGSATITAPVIDAPLIPITTSVTVDGIRYALREDGNIYDLFTDDLAPLRLTNTTIPRVHDAVFGNNGANVLLRYLADDGITIATFSATIPPQTTGQTTTDSAKALLGTFLPQNIFDISLSPKLDKMLYLEHVTDGSIGTTASFTNSTKNSVFTSPLAEWRTAWISDKVILFTTKPSGTVPGYAYSLDTTTKTFIRTLGEIPGLITLPAPSGKKILYSQTVGKEVALGVYDATTKTAIDLGIRTLAEKCTWKSDDIVYCAVPNDLLPTTYPDSWYQGSVSFSDSIWKLDLSTNQYSLLINPGDVSIDVIEPALSLDQTYLYFINKKDATVWALNLIAN